MTTLTIDPVLMADLSATCNNLGYVDDATEKYHKEPECTECVKDLIHFLRRDDENHEIRRALGEAKVVIKDLIPIIKHHSSDAELLDVTLRLLVNLTTPALILYEEELPGERISRRHYLEVIQYLQSYKEAFSDKVFWTVLATKMTSLAEKDWEHRMEDDRLTMERILILLRNVLSIPANPAAEKRTDDDASVHDQVLWALHLAGVDDIILFIAQSDEEQYLCMHVLEVVSLMLREQDAKQLARSGAARSQQERQKDISELEQIRRQEHEEKLVQMRKLTSIRHPRFGGTYRVQNLSSISNRDLIYHRPLSQISELSFDKDKVPRKTPKNRQPLADGEATRRSMLTIRLYLKQFCAEFLAGAYNKIMYNVKDDLVRARAQAHDESYYLWAVKFFMEFNRHHHFRVDRISETLSVSIFHYIQTQMESHLEMMAVEKRRIKIWSKRAHLALRAYQELLFTIQHMDASNDASTREASRVLKSNVFYMPEYRELLYVLLCQYDPVKMSRKFLTDLVGTTHVFIKLLEKFSGGGRIVVKQKRKVRKRSHAPCPGVRQPVQRPLLDPGTSWDNLSDELSAALQGHRPLPDDARPFDAASDVPLQQQRMEAMLRIQELLRTGRPTDALALIRTAREIWPEGDAFGSVNITPEEEFLALREIHFAELPDRPERQPSPPPEHRPMQPDEEEEEGEAAVENMEQDFDFKDFMKRFVTVKVIEPYCRLLRHFDTNTPEANHCILKMLHRVAWDHQMPAMLFQASLFRTFQRMMEDARHYRNPALKELLRFAKFILHRFFSVAETNKKAFMELLFWKSAREAYEVEHGYGTHQEASKATKMAWSEEEEDELIRVYEDLKDTENSDTERDLLDRILDTLICRDRTRRQVAKKLKLLGVVSATRQLTRPPRAGPPRQWTQAETVQLTELWQQHREADDPLTMIFDRLTVRRPKNRIRDKLLDLGLATDKKQLYKRRPAGNGRLAHSDCSGRADMRRSSSGSSDDEEDAGATRTKVAVGGTERRRAAARLVRPVKPAVPAASRAHLAATAAAYLQSGGDGAREVLGWLQESLEEAETLRRAEPAQPVALVPVSETCALALETDSVRPLLALLGAQTPSDGEMFWRWSSALDTETLLRNAAVLADCAAGRLQTNGKFLEEDGSDEESGGLARAELSCSLHVASFSEHKQPTPTPSSGSARPLPSDDENSVRAAAPNASVKRRKRVRRMKSDSDDETSGRPMSAASVATRRSRAASDSGDETAGAQDAGGSVAFKFGRNGEAEKRALSSGEEGSDLDTPRRVDFEKKPRRIIESESE